MGSGVQKNQNLWPYNDQEGYFPEDQHFWATYFAITAPPINIPFPYPHYVSLHTIFMCAQIFHVVNIDVPAGVGAPPQWDLSNMDTVGTKIIVQIQRREEAIMW